MVNINLNLLSALDALLTERNITRAAKVKAISISSMNRALESLRNSLDDQLLVKSGRVMILTPYATNIAPQIKTLVHQLEQTFNESKQLNLQSLERQFTLRASSGFAESYGAILLNRLQQEAPRVSLKLIDKEQKKSNLLERGYIDAEISVVTNNTEQDMKSRLLIRDKFVGVTQLTHPISEQQITLEALKNHDFIGVNRYSEDENHSLSECSCNIVNIIKPPILTVSGFSTAISILKKHPLIGIVPEHFTMLDREDVFKFELPFKVPSIELHLLWHPRVDKDPAHKWFRNIVCTIFFT